MTSKRPNQRTGRGPFRADQLRPGDTYELSNDRPLECVPTGGRGSRAKLVGGVALGTGPDVTAVGFDTGFTPEPGTLRAPDLAIGNVPDAAGWVEGASLLTRRAPMVRPTASAAPCAPPSSPCWRAAG